MIFTKKLAYLRNATVNSPDVLPSLLVNRCIFIIEFFFIFLFNRVQLLIFKYVLLFTILLCNLYPSLMWKLGSVHDELMLHIIFCQVVNRCSVEICPDDHLTAKE